VGLTERELALRRTIFEAFAATGGPPQVEDVVTLRSLAEQQCAGTATASTRTGARAPSSSRRRSLTPWA
jgi:hypothetical protein